MTSKDEDTQDFAAMLAEFDQVSGPPQKRRDLRAGEDVRGRVVSIGRDVAFLDIGGKSEGVLELADLRDADGNLGFDVGDEVEAKVAEVSRDGGVVLRKRLSRGRGGEAGEAELGAALISKLPVEGLVTGVNKGGLEVQVLGLRAFCPLSQVDLRPVAEPASFIGQRLLFVVTKVARDSRGLDVVLSRRQLLEEEQAGRADITRGKLAIGAVVRGTVTSLKDFGAFVDLGGIEGLIHVSELGFSRVGKPEDVLQVGQDVEVQVVRIEKTDDPRRPERVGLSLKALAGDPWGDIKQRFPEGAKLAGKVVRLESFGAFVELAPGIEGLVHLGELGAKKRVRHAKEAVKVGQAVEVTVLEVDVSRRRIGLSMASDAADGASVSDVAAVKAAPEKLGTFADLFKKK